MLHKRHKTFLVLVSLGYLFKAPYYLTKLCYFIVSKVLKRYVKMTIHFAIS